VSVDPAFSCSLHAERVNIAAQPGHSLTSSFHNINLSTKITVAVEIDWLLVGDEMAMDDMG